MKKSSYMDRAMKSRDPRFARVLGKLGYESREMKADNEIAAPIVEPKAPTDDRAELREEYKRIFGKKPYAGWDADTLLEKIVEAS